MSYWDPRFYGHVFMPIEIVLGLCLIVLIGRRFRSHRVWAALVFLSLGYAASLAAGQVSEGVHPRGPGSCDDASERWSAIELKASHGDLRGAN